VNGCNLKGLCRIVGISRQSHYKLRKKRQRKLLDEQLVLDLVLSIRARHPRMGTLKLLAKLKPKLKEAEVEIGRDRLFDLLRRRALLVQPKKRSARTTYSDHSLPVYRNLLYALWPTASDQAWVSDITYIDTDEGFLYLSLVSDLHSRKIVGWNAAETLAACESVKALRMAIEQLPENRWPLHHSDRGSQYCCGEYVKVLAQRNLPVSMTEANHCYENCYAERINGTLKLEYNLDLRFRSRSQALLSIEEAISLYNDERPHASLNMRSPSEAHRQAA